MGVDELTTEPLDPHAIASLAETLDIMLTPGATEALNSAREDVRAGRVLWGVPFLDDQEWT